jgi:hypothetical protein
LNDREEFLSYLMINLGTRLVELDWKSLSPRQRCVVPIFMQYSLDLAHLDFFLYYPDRIPDLVDALETIGADHSAQYVKDLCKLFPGGAPSTNAEECQKQIEEITNGDVVSFEDMVPHTELERDLFQRLFNYWRREAPIVEVDLAVVQTAADLLAALSKALGLPDSYGNSVDKFGRALAASVDVPRLILHGWARVAKLLPRDTEVLLEFLREFGKEHPELAVVLDLR